MPSLILAFFHSTINPTVVTTLITVGLALIAGALIGTGLEAAGVKIAAIQGWPRQLIVGVFGLLVASLGFWSSSAEGWQHALDAFESDSVHVPPYPEARLIDELGTLAKAAGRNHDKNCQVADFISVHSVPLPPIIKRELKQANSSSSTYLECYVSITSGARVAVNTAHRAVLHDVASATQPNTNSTSVASLHTEQVKVDASTRILKAATESGITGWMYLGILSNPATLSAGRTVFEQHVNVNQAITTTSDVNLHDAAAQSDFAAAQIAGIVPRNSQVLTKELQKVDGRYLWAKVQLLHNGDTDATTTVGGITAPPYGCPQRADTEAVRSNSALWIVLGKKQPGSDRLSQDAGVDAFCVPRKGEVVTIVSPAVVYTGWDPHYDHLPGHNELTLAGNTLPPLSTVQITTGLGGIPMRNGIFTVYAPITVVSTPGP